MRFEEAAKNSSVWWRMRAPSGAEMRSVVVLPKVLSISEGGMETWEEGRTSWIVSGDNAWTSIAMMWDMYCCKGTVWSKAGYISQLGD